MSAKLAISELAATESAGSAERPVKETLRGRHTMSKFARIALALLIGFVVGILVALALEFASNASGQEPMKSWGTTRLQIPTGEFPCSRLAHGNVDPVGQRRLVPVVLAAWTHNGSTSNGRHTPIQESRVVQPRPIDKGRASAVHGDLPNCADDGAKTPAVPLSGSWGERTTLLCHVPKQRLALVQAEVATARRDGHSTLHRCEVGASPWRRGRQSAATFRPRSSAQGLLAAVGLAGSLRPRDTCTVGAGGASNAISSPLATESALRAASFLATEPAESWTGNVKTGRLRRVAVNPLLSGIEGAEPSRCPGRTDCRPTATKADACVSPHAVGVGNFSDSVLS